MKVVIHWFRRDLRLSDNTALAEAASRAAQVVPVFILEEGLYTGPDVSAARLAFVLQALRALDQELAQRGYRLLVRRGSPEAELPKLAAELRAEAVFCNRCSEPQARSQDERVFAALNAARVGFETFKDAVIWEGDEILTQTGKPFTVFTPYARAWRARKPPPPRPPLGPAQARPPRVRSEPLPTDPKALGHPLRQSVPPAGEPAGRQALEQFLAGPVFEYARKRDYPALDGTSKLSPHLCAGTLGIRTVLHRLAAARQRADSQGQVGCDTFLTELIWREFYHQVLVNFPHVARSAFRPEYDELAWSQRQDHFEAWCAGRTGYPIVDAAMRCLNATGWLHNRLRMIVAMFLTKDLLISWQWGERYFMQQLVDGDWAANNGGWQWCAGTGTDAAPYFRIFNPVRQGEKFDPGGQFVRRWVPELAGVPDRFIHQPWKAPGGLAGTGYPQPIVWHEQQRARCLALYRKTKSHA